MTFNEPKDWSTQELFEYCWNLKLIPNHLKVSEYTYSKANLIALVENSSN